MAELQGRIGNYEVLANIREGGMARLYLARRLGVDGFSRLVALKVIHPQYAGNRQFARMFVDEALLSARIHHPNVVHVEELGRVDDTYFLAMGYVHGASLSQLVRALRAQAQRLTPALAVRIVTDVAAGLHAAHETRGDAGEFLGVVHRDISPQNILISTAGHVSLIDFGVAKLKSRLGESVASHLKGKVRYMSPEQAAGGAVDRRADIYSLALIAWELLTMRAPFVAEDDRLLLAEVRAPRVPRLASIEPSLPRELSQAIAGALSVDPAMRPASAWEFRRDLLSAMPAALQVEPGELASALSSALGDQIVDVTRFQLGGEAGGRLDASGGGDPSPIARPASFAPPSDFGSSRSSGSHALSGQLLSAIPPPQGASSPLQGRGAVGLLTASLFAAVTLGAVGTGVLGVRPSAPRPADRSTLASPPALRGGSSRDSPAIVPHAALPDPLAVAPTPAPAAPSVSLAGRAVGSASATPASSPSAHLSGTAPATHGRRTRSRFDASVDTAASPSKGEDGAGRGESIRPNGSPLTDDP